MGNLFGNKQQTQTTQVSPQVTQAFTNLMNRGMSVANQPLQQYGGPMVAGFTPDQTASFQNIENAQGLALPFYNSGAQMAGQGASAAAGGIGQYLNPYQHSVTDATLANMAENDAQQRQGLIGNAISKGAWGGDRAGVAQAELSRQQNLADNSTLASLNYNNYATALGASQNDASRALQGAQIMGGLGSGAQNSALQGAAALNSAGAQQQTLAQQQLNVPYQQFQQQQQYPFQTTQFLAGLMGGAAPNMGSTTSTPGPSGVGQVAGLAASLAPFFMNSGGNSAATTQSLWNLAGTGVKTGGRIGEYDSGGEVPQVDTSFFEVHNDPSAGGGLGAWNNPMAQYHPSDAPIITKLPDSVLNPPKVIPGVKPKSGTNSINSVFDVVGPIAHMIGQMFLKDGGEVKGYDTGGPVWSTSDSANGVAIPTIDRSRFAVHNDPGAMGGLGAWFNPLAQQHTAGAPIVTQLPGSVTSPPDYLALPKGKKAGLNFNSYEGLGALAGLGPLIGLPIKTGGRVGGFAAGGDTTDDDGDDYGGGLDDDDMDDISLATGIGAGVPHITSVVPQPLQAPTRAAPQAPAQPAPQQGGLGATVDPSSLPALTEALAQQHGSAGASPETPGSNPFGLSDKGYAIMQAGLGTLASGSPFPLQAMGQGMQQGLAAYQQAKSLEAQQAYHAQEAQYRTLAAEAAMKRAESMSELHHAQAAQVGDKTMLISSGKTVHVIHKAGDGTIEDHDLGIPTAQWSRLGIDEKRAAIAAGNAAESARHNRASEANEAARTAALAGGPGGTSLPPWEVFK